MYTTSTMRTVATEVYLNIDMPQLKVNKELEKCVISRFESVKETNIYKQCSSCHKSIEVTNKKLVKCSNCDTRLRSVDLKIGAKCTVNYLYKQRRESTFCVKEVKERIVKWAIRSRL